MAVDVVGREADLRLEAGDLSRHLSGDLRGGNAAAQGASQKMRERGQTAFRRNGRHRSEWCAERQVDVQTDSEMAAYLGQPLRVCGPACKRHHGARGGQVPPFRQLEDAIADTCTEAEVIGAKNDRLAGAHLLVEGRSGHVTLHRSRARVRGSSQTMARCRWFPRR